MIIIKAILLAGRIRLCIYGRAARDWSQIITWDWLSSLKEAVILTSSWGTLLRASIVTDNKATRLFQRQFYYNRASLHCCFISAQVPALVSRRFSWSSSPFYSFLADLTCLPRTCSLAWGGLWPCWACLLRWGAEKESFKRCSSTRGFILKTSGPNTTV